MSTQSRFELESALVDQLHGHLRVLQEQGERIKIVSEALTRVFQEGENGRFKKDMEDLSDEDSKNKFIEEFLSYGPLTKLLSDIEVEDIIVNDLNPIHIHHSQEGFVPTDFSFTSREEMNLFIRKLVLFSGRDKIEKVMNLELPNLEGRVNCISSPFGPQLTITKAKMSPLSILDLVKGGAMSYEVAAQFWLYIEGMHIKPANIIIAGGPGVGKTTLLNALFSFVPASDRLVVIEDTLELNTEFDLSCSRLESGEEFNLADLVKNSLRMRPERIIVGEVRGEEARDMVTAANIGKYCIGTIHALTARESIMRLQNEPMNVPEELIRLIDVFVVLKRYHVDHKMFRVIDEVSETSGMEQEKILLSQIYKYDYDKGQCVPLSTSTVYRDRLAQQAGLHSLEIILELHLRTFVLEQLAQKGLTTMREVTSFCRAYSKNPDEAVKNLGFDRQEMLAKARKKVDKP